MHCHFNHWNYSWKCSDYSFSGWTGDWNVKNLWILFLLYAFVQNLNKWNSYDIVCVWLYLTRFMCNHFKIQSTYKIFVLYWARIWLVSTLYSVHVKKNKDNVINICSKVNKLNCCVFSLACNRDVCIRNVPVETCSTENNLFEQTQY